MFGKIKEKLEKKENRTADSANTDTTISHDELAAAELVFIIDRSGSMSGMEKETVGGVNAVLDEHRNSGATTYVSIVLFDHEMIRFCEHADIAEVAFTEDDYVPRGMTALLDAVGMTISEMHEHHDDGKVGKTIVVIVTDGMENSSKEYSYTSLNELVSKAKTEWGWEFMFLGANIDAEAEAAHMGIDRKMAAKYVNDSQGANVMYQAVAKASATMRTRAYAENQAVLDDWSESISEDLASRG